MPKPPNAVVEGIHTLVDMHPDEQPKLAPVEDVKMERDIEGTIQGDDPFNEDEDDEEEEEEDDTSGSRSNDTCVDSPRSTGSPEGFALLGMRRNKISCFVQGLCCTEKRPVLLEVKECPGSGRGNQWTRGENMLLVGAVFMVLSERGSLFPSTRKGKRVGYYTKQGGSDTWDRVKVIFDDMKRDHAPVGFKERTPTALSRHYKFLRGTPGMEDLLQNWLEFCGNVIIGDPSKLAIATIGSNDGWSVHEDVVLVGAVFERFFSSGSRCAVGLRDEFASWFEIKDIYDLAWSRLKISKPCERNVRQLHTRYKKMKRALKKIHEGDCSLKTYIQAYRWFLQGCTLQSTPVAAPVQCGKRKRECDS